MHPVFELILNPVAGPAGFNLVSVGFYFMIALCIVGAIVEWRNANRSRRVPRSTVVVVRQSEYKKRG